MYKRKKNIWKLIDQVAEMEQPVAECELSKQLPGNFQS